MNKEQLMAMGLTEEQADKVLAGIGTTIPKSRFDEVNDAKKKLETDLVARDKQLEDLKKVDAEGLQAQIEKLQGENTTAKEQHEAQIKKIQIDGAVDRALTGAKAKNIKAVKALLDLDKAELDGETIKGLEDQLKKLQEGEDSKFLFDAQSTTQQPKFKGIKPGESGEGQPGGGTQPSSLAEAVKMHFTSSEQNN
ncbi:phage scaffolding protein [Paenibacillus sp. FA6]|uniref:phage scaffolding protein n=1 Tax=Paenibacillus sp. FA6 TaxID=3413029 RepID=UPI003F65D1E1